jgi:hypothetical protein
MTGSRNWTIDVARIVSLVIVMLLHWLSERVTVREGTFNVDPDLHGTWIWTLTWLLQIMPLFFLCGGFVNTRVIDRCRAQGLSYGEYLGLRARRLTTPVIALIGVIVPLTVVLAMVSERAARALAIVVGRPLWFLAVYLLAAAVAPGAVWLHDRSPLLAPTLLAACALSVDLLRFAGHDERYVEANVVFVWLFCHQLGVLHARGTPHCRDSTVIGLGVLAAVLIWLLVTRGPYPPTAVGLADAPVSNLAPPTTVMCLLGVAQLALMTVLARHTAGWEPHGRVRAFIGTTNALLMIIYLWHVPVLTAVTGVGLLDPDTLLPSDDLSWWLMRPAWFLVCGAALFAVVRLMTRWELFCAKYSARTSTPVVLVATTLSIVGIYQIWTDGLSLAGDGKFWVGCVLLAGALLTGATPASPATGPAAEDTPTDAESSAGTPADIAGSDVGAEPDAAVGDGHTGPDARTAQ